MPKASELFEKYAAEIEHVGRVVDDTRPDGMPTAQILDALGVVGGKAREVHAACHSRTPEAAGFEVEFGAWGPLVRHLATKFPAAFDHPGFAQGLPEYFSTPLQLARDAAAACRLLSAKAREAGDPSLGVDEPAAPHEPMVTITPPTDPDEPALERDAREVAVLYVLSKPESRAGLLPVSLAGRADDWLTKHAPTPDIGRIRCSNPQTIRPVAKRLLSRGYVDREGARGLIRLSPAKGVDWVKRHPEPAVSAPLATTAP